MAVVDKGADVNSADIYGQTPVLYAAEGNGTVALLVDKGADVNVANLVGPATVSTA